MIQAYLNRVKQVQPKILFTIDQFQYNKETIYLLKNIKDITDGKFNITLFSQKKCLYFI